MQPDPECEGWELCSRHFNRLALDGTSNEQQLMCSNTHSSDPLWDLQLHGAIPFKEKNHCYYPNAFRAQIVTMILLAESCNNVLTDMSQHVLLLVRLLIEL